MSAALFGPPLVGATIAPPCASAQDRPSVRHATRVLRRPANRHRPSRQLPRRLPQLGGAAGQPRLHLLRRRPARHHRELAGARRAGAADARDGGDAAGLRHQPAKAHPVRAVVGPRARAACLDLQLRRAPRLAEPHDAVQGQGRQEPRECLGGTLRLSEPDGGRHPGLSRDRRAGGRGPATAPRTGQRHRAEVQPRHRRGVLSRRSLR